MHGANRCVIHLHIVMIVDKNYLVVFQPCLEKWAPDIIHAKTFISDNANTLFDAYNAYVNLLLHMADTSI